MDTIHIKRKQEEVERVLYIFFPSCTKRHPRNDCPLNFKEVYYVYEENHAIDKHSSLSCLKYIDQGVKDGSKQLSHINRTCGVHIILLITQIKMHLSILGTLPLIYHVPCPLLGLILLNICLNLSSLPSSHILVNLLNGVNPHKDGGFK